MTDLWTRAKRLISDILIWLRPMKYSTVIFACIISVISLLIWTADGWERFFRLTGLALQTAGFVTVWVGLRQTGTLFQRPHPIKALKAFWARRPWVSGSVALSPSSGILNLQGGRARPLIQAPPNSTLENRILLLENGQKRLDEEITNLHNNIYYNHENLHIDIINENKQRKEADEQIFQVVYKASVGGIYMEWFSLFMFISGVFMSTASPEIASLLDYFPSCDSGWFE